MTSRSAAHTWPSERDRAKKKIRTALSSKLGQLAACLGKSSQTLPRRFRLSIVPRVSAKGRKTRIYTVSPTSTNIAIKRCLTSRVAKALHAGKVPVSGRGGWYTIRIAFTYRQQ